MNSVADFKQNSIENLCEILNSLSKKRETLLIRIDGCGGAGKSTLAQAIKDYLPDVKIVHMDDFTTKTVLIGGG